MKHQLAFRYATKVAAALALSFALGGCAVVAIADAAVSVAASAVSVAATVVETGVDVTAGAVKAVAGSGDKSK